MNYRFPETGTRRRRQRGAYVPEERVEEQIGLIQGRVPQSKEEWWVAKALWRLKEEFIYQFEFFGGHIRGGQILDFLVHTVPFKTALDVKGEYWHRNEMTSEVRFNLFLLEAELHGWAVLEVLWGKDLPNEEETYLKVRDVLR